MLSTNSYLGLDSTLHPSLCRALGKPKVGLRVEKTILGEEEPEREHRKGRSNKMAL